MVFVTQTLATFFCDGSSHSHSQAKGLLMMMAITPITNTMAFATQFFLIINFKHDACLAFAASNQDITLQGRYKS